MGRKKKLHLDTKNLERFLREKVEVERLADYQIAQILNVGTTTVFNWRHKFRIPPADKFERKFREKYGRNAIRIFQKMVEDNATFREIGDHFGFSREYARQVYRKLFSPAQRRRWERQRSSQVGRG